MDLRQWPKFLETQTGSPDINILSKNGAPIPFPCTILLNKSINC